MAPHAKKPSTAADLWIAISLAVCGLVFALYIPLGWGPPSLQDLIPAEGRLLSYSLYQTAGGRSSRGDLLALISIDGTSGRFWNDELKNGNVNRVKGQEGSIVRVMYARAARFARINGDAVKSWGLWIDGVEIQSAQDAINSDRILASLVLPLFGVAFSVFGIVRARYIRRELSARESQGTG